MLNKYLLIALAVLVALLGASGLLLRSSYKANGVQKAQILALNATILRAVEQSNLNTLTLDQLAQKNAALAILAGQRGSVARAAIRKNAQWADTPVPQEVQDALSTP